MTDLIDQVRAVHTDAHASSCDCGIPGLCVVDQEDMPCSALQMADELERNRALVVDLQRRILGGFRADDQNDRHGYSAPTWGLLSSVLTQHGFDPAWTAGGER